MSEEITPAQILEALNNKADRDLGNMSIEAGEHITDFTFPSKRYDTLTLGAANTRYTAPGNGWFVIGKRASADGQWLNVELHDESGNAISEWWSDCGGGFNGKIVGHMVPCKKGYTINIDYNVAGALTSFRFIYAEGSR